MNAPAHGPDQVCPNPPVKQIADTTDLSTLVPNHFRHPGTTMGPELIHRLCHPLEQPTKVLLAAREAVVELATSFLPLGPQAVPSLWVGSWAGDPPPEGYLDGTKHPVLREDSARAYQCSLAFLVTGQSVFARKALEIIDAWSTINVKIAPNEKGNGPLECGWALPGFARTVELLTYTYLEWPGEVTERFVRYVRSVMYPGFHYRDSFGWKCFSLRNNWGAAIMEGRLLFSIMTEDRAEFAFVLERLRFMWQHMFVEPRGRVVETTRDMWHAAVGLAGLVQCAEVLWHQGIDIYSFNDDVLRDSLEYHACVWIAERDRDTSRMPQDLQAIKVVINGRPYTPISWDIAIHHYVERSGRTMPRSEELVACYRPDYYTFFYGASTLTHYLSSKHLPAVS